MVACTVTFLVGAVLQLNKLAVLDSAGRQFSQESYASKTGFLVPFAISKALCNLVVDLETCTLPPQVEILCTL